MLIASNWPLLASTSHRWIKDDRCGRSLPELRSAVVASAPTYVSACDACSKLPVTCDARRNGTMPLEGLRRRCGGGYRRRRLALSLNMGCQSTQARALGGAVRRVAYELPGCRRDVCACSTICVSARWVMRAPGPRSPRAARRGRRPPAGGRTVRSAGAEPAAIGAARPVRLCDSARSPASTRRTLQHRTTVRFFKDL